MHNLTFLNNRAFVYGDDIASVPKYLLEVAADQLNLTSFKAADQSLQITSSHNSGVMADV